MVLAIAKTWNITLTGLSVMRLNEFNVDCFLLIITLCLIEEEKEEEEENTFIL